MRKIAAIDIGSNAIRLVIADLTLDSFFVRRKIRVPFRLGAEAFSAKRFSIHTISEVGRIFERFAHIMNEEGVDAVLAYGTSAMREAENSDTLMAGVLRNTGIRIEIIDGDAEARLIRDAVLSKTDLSGKNVLLMDIGGGSTELSIIETGVLRASRSFDVGTVRMLQSGPAHLKSRAGEIEAFLSKYARSSDLKRLIGTGGNFRAILKLKGRILELRKARFIRSSEFSRIRRELASCPPFLGKTNPRSDFARNFHPSETYALGSGMPDSDTDRFRKV